MKVIIVISALVGLVFCRPQYEPAPLSTTPVPILSFVNEITPEGGYSYSYQSADGIYKEEYATPVKDADGNITYEIRGSYSYNAPDGTPIKVDYTSGLEGFKAEGAHLPVAPAPIDPSLYSTRTSNVFDARSSNFKAQAAYNTAAVQASGVNSEAYKAFNYQKSNSGAYNAASAASNSAFNSAAYKSAAANTNAYNSGAYNAASVNTAASNSGSYNEAYKSAASVKSGAYNAAANTYNTGAYNAALNTAASNSAAYNDAYKSSVASSTSGAYNAGAYNAAVNIAASNTGAYNAGNAYSDAYKSANAAAYNTAAYNAGASNVGAYNNGAYNEAYKTAGVNAAASGSNAAVYNTASQSEAYKTAAAYNTGAYKSASLGAINSAGAYKAGAISSNVHNAGAYNSGAYSDTYRNANSASSDVAASTAYQSGAYNAGYKSSDLSTSSSTFGAYNDAYKAGNIQSSNFNTGAYNAGSALNQQYSASNFAQSSEAQKAASFARSAYTGVPAGEGVAISSVSFNHDGKADGVASGFKSEIVHPSSGSQLGEFKTEIFQGGKSGIVGTEGARSLNHVEQSVHADQASKVSSQVENNQFSSVQSSASGVSQASEVNVNQASEQFGRQLPVAHPNSQYSPVYSIYYKDFNPATASVGPIQMATYPVYGLRTLEPPAVTRV